MAAVPPLKTPVSFASHTYGYLQASWSLTSGFTRLRCFLPFYMSGSCTSYPVRSSCRQVWIQPFLHAGSCNKGGTWDPHTHTSSLLPMYEDAEKQAKVGFESFTSRFMHLHIMFGTRSSLDLAQHLSDLILTKCRVS
eukprot:1156170-Pelagomonas_calceolata.AAC.9